MLNRTQLTLIIWDIFSRRSLFSVSIWPNLSSMRAFFLAFVFRWDAARGHLLSMLHFMSRSCSRQWMRRWIEWWAVSRELEWEVTYLAKYGTNLLLVAFLASLNMTRHASFVLHGHSFPTTVHCCLSQMSFAQLDNLCSWCAFGNRSPNLHSNFLLGVSA